ncbi:hypothetical protein D8832_07430 [Streptococcus intermedius]|nr:hypothetical protein D8832_07430 [Streptococcus intermedius]
MYLNIFLFTTLLIVEIKQKVLLLYYTTIIGPIISNYNLHLSI